MKKYACALVALALASLALACPATTADLGDAVGPGAGQALEEPAMMSIEEVKSWAGPAARVTRVGTPALPGAALFWVDTSQSEDRDAGFGVLVSAGSPTPLRGVDAVRALMGAAPLQPEVLARLCMLFLEQGGEPLLVAENDEDRQAGVAAPAVNGRVLEYWSRFRVVSQPGLARSRVDLDTLVVEQVAAQQLQRAARDPIDQAAEWLATSNLAFCNQAIQLLVANCADARAAVMLGSTLASHGQPTIRAEAARVLGTCHDAGSVASLIQALQVDADANVRTKAATALGAIGDPTARPALEQAAAQEAALDPKYAAKRALKKLP